MNTAKLTTAELLHHPTAQGPRLSKSQGSAHARNKNPVQGVLDRPAAATRKVKTTDSLTEGQVAQILAAGRFAMAIDLPLNRFVTFAWTYAEVVDASAATARFFKLAADAMRKRKIPWAWVWVLESGPIHGAHLHALMHIPTEHQPWFNRRCHRWARLCGMRRKQGARHSRPVGLKSHSTSYLLNLERALEYLVKDACAPARAKFTISRDGDHGIVFGKRAGVSQNLGAKARSRHPDRKFDHPIAAHGGISADVRSGRLANT